MDSSLLKEGLALKRQINVARIRSQSVNKAVSKLVAFKPGCKTAALVREGIFCELEKRTTETWDQDMLEMANRCNPDEFSRAFVYDFKPVSRMAVDALLNDPAVSREWTYILKQARRTINSMSFAYKDVTGDFATPEDVEEYYRNHEELLIMFAQESGALNVSMPEKAPQEESECKSIFSKDNSTLTLGELFKKGLEYKRRTSKCSIRLQEINNIIAREVTFKHGCKTVSIVRNGVLCEVKRKETESWDNGVLTICYRLMPEVISSAFTYRYKPVSAKAVRTVLENPANGDEWRAMIEQARTVTSNTIAFKYRDVNDACLLRTNVR